MKRPNHPRYVRRARAERFARLASRRILNQRVGASGKTGSSSSPKGAA